MTTSQALTSDPDLQRRRDLREFLMTRRARVTPAEAGLPDGGARRRTPGLRREEVAVLAGVGVSWYQWLEQGRDITVSPQVLDAVSRVLRLNDAERRHLYVLAGLNPPLPSAAAAPVSDGLRRLIDAWMPFPAHILDPYWNTITFNEAAGLVFGYGEQDVNCLVSYFTNPIYRARNTTWEANAGFVVAQFRAAVSERRGTPATRRSWTNWPGSARSSRSSGPGVTSRRAGCSARRSTTRRSGCCGSRAPSYGCPSGRT